MRTQKICGGYNDRFHALGVLSEEGEALVDHGL